jgi:hypothetical protein
MIRDELREIHKTLEYHTAEVHGTLVDREEIEERDHRIDEAMRAALLGPLVAEGIHAGTRVSKLGIEYKVNELWTQTQNGGVRARLSKSDKVALYGPTVTAIGVVVAAWLGVF